MECPEEPYDLELQPGDVEIRFRQLGPLDMSGLDAVVEVRCKWVESRAENRQERCDALHRLIDRATGLDNFGVYLSVPIAAGPSQPQYGAEDEPGWERHGAHEGATGQGDNRGDAEDAGHPTGVARQQLRGHDAAAGMDYHGEGRPRRLGGRAGPRRGRVSAGQEQFEDGFGVSGVMS